MCCKINTKLAGVCFTCKKSHHFGFVGSESKLEIIISRKKMKEEDILY